MRITSLAAVILAALALPSVSWAVDDQEQVMGDVTVTGTREARKLSETPASIGLIRGESIQKDKPTHPAQVMGKIPGALVNVTGGEGHMTAIRQPVSTAPVYLYLEDGVPTRSTGFFNHNALYEINIPAAGGVEVLKGPGTALYGSDAIGGVINVLTRTPPTQAEIYGSAAMGGHGWWRALVGGGNAYGSGAWRGDLNLTHTDGWRDATDYDRQSGTLRWDHDLGDASLLKTVLAFSTIDQQTAGSSAIVFNDFLNNPTRNYTPISYRKVDALRLSSAWERESGGSLFSVTPYVRDNSMELLANWSLSYDPTVYATSNQSFGVLAKWRQDFAPMRSRLIAGVDVDYSPGGREEDRLATLTTTGAGASKVYTAYTAGTRVFDYDVTFSGVSPYVHGEFSPSERLRVTAGLRYDQLSYDFDNHFAVASVAASTSENGGAPVTRHYGQTPDTRVDFSHFSPKLGATYALAADTSLFVSYNHAFRAPSEGQMFRPSAATTAAVAVGNAQAALGLEPVKADQFEVGIRGRVQALDYSVSIYDLTKKDDILSYTEAGTGITRSVNAGETSHRGVELGGGLGLASNVRFDAAMAWSEHIAEEWAPPTGANLSGKDLVFAPKFIGNFSLTWEVSDSARLLFEWVSVGSYAVNESNSLWYEGYNIQNMRANWSLNKNVGFFGSIHNLVNRRYAESSGWHSFSGTQTYSPGLPRTLYAGIEAKW